MPWCWIVLGGLTVLAWAIAWTHLATRRDACVRAREVLLSTRETDYVVLSARVEGRIAGRPSEWVEREIRAAQEEDSNG